MISTEQEKEITLYLISKKLYPQILFEVKDHFISQISDLMETKSLNFQEAFLETKISWNHELEMVHADIFSFKKIARIEKNQLQKQFNKIMINSVFFAILSAIMYAISDTLFFYFQVIFLSVFALLLLSGFVFRKISFRDYQRISFHPLILRDIILGLVLFPLICYFSGNFNFWEPVFNQLIIFYTLTIQIQLLYFRTKKINVLV
jgi:hypothetical protein